MKPASHLFRRFAFATLLATTLLSGCGLVPVKPLEQQLETQTSVEPDKAVIVLKLQMGQGSFLPGQLRWQGLLLAEETDGTTKPRSQLAINVEPTYAEHSLFVAVVPAGKWRPVQVSVTQFFNNGSTDYRYPLGKVGSFTVKAGEIADLGAIAILPTSKSVESGNRNERRTNQSLVAIALPLATAEREQLLSIVRSRMPANLTLRQDSAWTLEPLQALLRTPLFRQGESTRFAAPLIDREEALFGEEFGQIRIRRKGEWHWLDTGLTSHVTALARTADGTMLAGGAHGVVLLKRPGSERWEARPLPARDAVVHGLHVHPKLGVIAAATHGPEVVIWSMASLDAPWVELKRVSASGNSNLGGSVSVQTAMTDKRFYARVNEVAFTANSNLHVLDLATGLWETHSTGFGMTSFTPEDVVFYLGGNAFSGSVNSSVDGGKTWQTQGSTGLPLLLKMVSSKKGYLERSESFVMKTSSVVYLLLKTEDGGKTWEEISRLPTHFRQIFEIAPDELLAVALSNQIFLSKDGGRTWREEGSERSRHNE